MNDPAKELDDLATAYEDAARDLRRAAASVRAALSGARQTTLQIDIPAAVEIPQVAVREVPFSEKYRGMSQADAAIDFINSAGRAVEKDRLFEGLKERGARVSSKQALAVALSRRQGLEYLQGEGWATTPVLLAMTKASLAASGRKLKP